MSATFISKIPDILVSLVTSKWFELNDVVKSDSAFCNSQSRQWYLSIIAMQTLESTEKKYSSIGYYQWIHLKNIRVKLLWFHCDLFCGNYSFPKLDFSEVLEIQYIVQTHHKSDETNNTKIMTELNENSHNGFKMHDIVNLCPKLTTLEFVGDSNLSKCINFNQINPEVLNKIKKFAMKTDDRHLQTQFLKVLVEHCKNLICLLNIAK